MVDEKKPPPPVNAPDPGGYLDTAHKAIAIADTVIALLLGAVLSVFVFLLLN
jgi:hypothetical protein